MTAPPPQSAGCPNRLLSLLPQRDYQMLLPHLEYVATPFNQVLFRRDGPIEHVYFPCSGAHSILALMEDGSSVEVGTVGNEGFSTIDVMLESDVATETTVCQIPGDALRVPVARFREVVGASAALRRLVLRYMQAYISLVSQSVACNRLHALEERFARWVLMSHDRASGDEFQLTQEYLAAMLGVHRPSVSLVARSYQQAGLIRYSRGKIEILDRAGLEEACCECYALVKRHFERAIGKATS